MGPVHNFISSPLNMEQKMFIINFSMKIAGKETSILDGFSWKGQELECNVIAWGNKTTLKQLP
jgi:hypothetical protein